MQDNPTEETTNFLDFGGEDFDFETWLGSSSDGFFVDGVLESSTLNQYIYTVSIEGSAISYGMTFMSEAFIEGQMMIDYTGVGMDCVITVHFNVALEE
ncbi:MAG: hypothetical protein Q9P01_02185 [Anaerolineae bacterium]|nr:hypothetical protein [Anaerolineae bacterium]MDQ7033668.1 hypothetical protein [Anaerolineae bacterium]